MFDGLSSTGIELGWDLMLYFPLLLGYHPCQLLVILFLHHL